jgi:hypothetical protein
MSIAFGNCIGGREMSINEVLTNASGAEMTPDARCEQVDALPGQLLCVDAQVGVSFILFK